MLGSSGESLGEICLTLLAVLGHPLRDECCRLNAEICDSTILRLLLQFPTLVLTTSLQAANHSSVIWELGCDAVRLSQSFLSIDRAFAGSVRRVHLG